MTTDTSPAIFGLVHDHGAFTPASAVPAPLTASSEQPDLPRPAFATTRRGYEPSSVDAHLSRLEENAAALRSALAESERRGAVAEQHALAVEDEIRIVRAGQSAAPTPQPSDSGFGARAERLLRLAETEAEQIRVAARRSASEVTQRAQTEAERHRHDVRQRLIADSARAEEQTARRTGELQDRENAVRAQVDRAHAEADLIRTTAQHAADAHRNAAQAAVDELRNRSTQELRRDREREERELARLRDLQGAVRLELTRLASAITAELAVPAPRPSPGPGRGSAATGATSGGLGAHRPGTRPGPARSGATGADASTGPQPTLRVHQEVVAVATS